MIAVIFALVVFSLSLFMLWVFFGYWNTSSFNIILSFAYKTVFEYFFPRFSPYERMLSYKDKYSISTMNYGYFPVGKHLQNDKEKYSKALYELVAGTNINDSSIVLEISSGRGGGLNHIHTKYAPSKCCGVELSADHVKISKTDFKESDSLEFKVGNAEDLPCMEDEFTTILNVEACHNYRTPLFFKEANRVLKSGGKLLCADIFMNKVPCGSQPRYYAADRFIELGLKQGFELTDMEDITTNVINASKRDEKRRMELLRENEKNPFVRIVMKLFVSFYVVHLPTVTYKRFVFRKL